MRHPWSVLLPALLLWPWAGPAAADAPGPAYGAGFWPLGQARIERLGAGGALVSLAGPPGTPTLGWSFGANDAVLGRAVPAAGPAADGGWSLVVDFGLASKLPLVPPRPDGALLGTQGFEATRRALRLSPTLQIGANWAF